jgi:hypothetical protein
MSCLPPAKRRLNAKSPIRLNFELLSVARDSCFFRKKPKKDLQRGAVVILESQRLRLRLLPLVEGSVRL